MDAELLKLAQQLGQHLQAQGQTLATAESCTGGWLAQMITAVPGSSKWFERGFIAYSNQAKRDMLGVKTITLARSGAVSEQTARAMAEGALAHSQAHLAVAITGIAGPDGGTPEKPVGSVCFAWATRDGGLRSQTACFSGDRESVRRQSVVAAMQGILDTSPAD